MRYIAVCDDDVNLLSTFRKILKKIGFEVFTTQTEEELHDLLKKQEIDVLFIDFNLEPVDFEDVPKNGLEIITDVRKTYDKPAMKIVLTTSVNFADIKDVKNAGGDEILYKPFLPLTKITDLLKKLSESE